MPPATQVCVTHDCGSVFNSSRVVPAQAKAYGGVSFVVAEGI